MLQNQILSYYIYYLERHNVYDDINASEVVPVTRQFEFEFAVVIPQETKMSVVLKELFETQKTTSTISAN